MTPPSHRVLLVFILAAENGIVEASGHRANWKFWWEHRTSRSFGARRDSGR